MHPTNFEMGWAVVLGVVPTQRASASRGNFLEMHKFESQPRPTEPASLGVGPSDGMSPPGDPNAGYVLRTIG